MTHTIAFTRLAKLDLDEIIIHIGKDDPRAAKRVANAILERIVAYRVDAAYARIEVLRIVHGARQWPARL